jgi:hypothetical protein
MHRNWVYKKILTRILISSGGGLMQPREAMRSLEQILIFYAATIQGAAKPELS